MQIVLKRHNGWWIADDGHKLFKSVGVATEKAGDVWRNVKLMFPNAKIGIESREFGSNTVMMFGNIVWMK